MAGDDLIERYLSQLDSELRLAARARRRIVAEARDHLHDLVAQAGPDPEAAQGAVMFRLSRVLCDMCTSSFVHAAPWVNDGPGSAPLWIFGQVGLIAGVVSLACARIVRRRGRRTRSACDTTFAGWSSCQPARC